jgi:hypothetical protein
MTDKVKLKLDNALDNISHLYPDGCAAYYSAQSKNTWQETLEVLDVALKSKYEIESLRAICWFEKTIIFHINKFKEIKRL